MDFVNNPDLLSQTNAMVLTYWWYWGKRTFNRYRHAKKAKLINGGFIDEEQNRAKGKL
jgi:predicted chitinase